MEYETLIYETDERIAIITLNRPNKLNAISLKMQKEFSEAVGTADQDPGIRVLVVTGAGDRAFSAGYDLEDPDEPPMEEISNLRTRLAGDCEFTYTVWNCSKPVIAMIDGYCLAGGLEFALMCDIRYCSEVSKFGVVETRFYNGIATLAMPWIIGARCRELIYTGDMIGAEEAFRLGIVNRVFPRSELRQGTMKIAKRMSQVALACLQWNKRALNNTLDVMGFPAAMRYGVEACTLMDAWGGPEVDEFNRLLREKGLREALKWRDEQFSAYE
jgi:enoyl-CoA hydratase/carnithine racemase